MEFIPAFTLNDQAIFSQLAKANGTDEIVKEAEIGLKLVKRQSELPEVVKETEQEQNSS